MFILTKIVIWSVSWLVLHKLILNLGDIPSLSNWVTGVFDNHTQLFDVWFLNAKFWKLHSWSGVKNNNTLEIFIAQLLVIFFSLKMFEVILLLTHFWNGNVFCNNEPFYQLSLFKTVKSYIAWISTSGTKQYTTDNTIWGRSAWCSFNAFFPHAFFILQPQFIKGSVKQMMEIFFMIVIKNRSLQKDSFSLI